MNSLPEKLTAEQLSHLTKKHIDRYTSMLDRAQKGDRQFRAGECAALLKIWESIAKKNMSLVGTDYTDVEADEIGDAWFDEYDECDNPYDSEMDSAGKPVRPDVCARCETTGKVTGHHHDYTKPLDVTWLCYQCHANEEHGR